jgi:hypothetical protein
MNRLVVAATVFLSSCSLVDGSYFRCHGHKTPEVCQKDPACYPIFRCGGTSGAPQRCRPECTTSEEGVCRFSGQTQDGCYLVPQDSGAVICKSFDGRTDRCRLDPIQQPDGIYVCLDADPPCAGCQVSLAQCSPRSKWSL